MTDLDKCLSGHVPDKVFMIMAGGTGGHIFPGLAVAEELKRHGFSIHWLGTSRGMEAELVPRYHFPISFLTVKGVRGKGIKALLMAPWRIVVSTFQAIRIMKKIKPVGVLGMGGFVAGPGGLAASLLGIPLIIHEQNAVAGITNRLSAPLAKKIFVAFPDAFPLSRKAIFTGNPVRRTIQPTDTKLSDHNELNILVLGGSSGALVINETLPCAVAALNSSDKLKTILNIWHQTGVNHYKFTCQRYEQQHIDARVVPFIDDMAAAYEWADLVICRSGALTVAELANAGKPSILIPYPWHKDKQQLRNAEYLVNHQAAILIEQKDLTVEKLTEIIQQVSQDRHLLKAMSQAAYGCAKPGAAETIARVCEEIICE